MEVDAGRRVEVAEGAQVLSDWADDDLGYIAGGFCFFMDSSRRDQDGEI